MNCQVKLCYTWQERVCGRVCELCLQHISRGSFSGVQARILPSVWQRLGEAVSAGGAAGSAGGQRLQWLGKAETGTFQIGAS